jgi:L-alanine-DL-glutamate epimerase-like enolase superfamily enzyme
VLLGQEDLMRISNVRVLLLSAPIPPERRWTSDFGTNTKQDVAIVIVETDAGLTGYGEALGSDVKLMMDAHGALTVDRGPCTAAGRGRSRARPELVRGAGAGRR